MTSQPKPEKRIQVKPPISDAVPPFIKARSTYALKKVQQQKVMEILGTAIYECRQKTKSKAPAILSAMPKGYVVEYSSGYKILGHPSSRRFDSANAFLEHLLWLEAMSHPESIEPRRTCKCTVCAPTKKMKNKQEIEMQDDTCNASKLDSSDEALSAEASSQESPTSPAAADDDDSKTIRVYPLKKILIERHATPHYYYPNEFTIPLPKIHESDESILLKSLR